MNAIYLVMVATEYGDYVDRVYYNANLADKYANEMDAREKNIACTYYVVLKYIHDHKEYA